MARYRDSVCKLCRREGIKLYLKGSRCFSEKCGVDRRNYPPGQHGPTPRRGRQQEYGRQLREKQKAKRYYGVMEKQFRRYYDGASRKEGVTGENLLRALECRLDNLVYRFGFAPSRPAARQMVVHGHVTVNGSRVKIPSYQVTPGDGVQVHESSRELAVIHESLGASSSKAIPWLSVDKAALRGELMELPAREDIPVPVEEQLIIELYSR